MICSNLVDSSGKLITVHTTVLFSNYRWIFGIQMQWLMNNANICGSFRYIQPVLDDWMNGSAEYYWNLIEILEIGWWGREKWIFRGCCQATFCIIPNILFLYSPPVSHACPAGTAHAHNARPPGISLFPTKASKCAHTYIIPEQVLKKNHWKINSHSGNQSIHSGQSNPENCNYLIECRHRSSFP